LGEAKGGCISNVAELTIYIAVDCVVAGFIFRDVFIGFPKGLVFQFVVIMTARIGTIYGISISIEVFVKLVESDAHSYQRPTQS